MLVAPGSRVATSGWPVVVGGERGLVLQREGTEYEPVLSLDLPWAVRTTQVAPFDVHGRLVTVIGTWDGERIDVLAAEEVQAPLAHEWTQTEPVSVSPALIQIVRMLTEDGLVAAWRTDTTPQGGALATICAFDVEPVAAALREIEGVQVTRCPWSRTEVRDARAVHESVPPELLCSFGEETLADGRPRITLEVKYATDELVTAVDDAAGLIEIRSLIIPAPRC